MLCQGRSGCGETYQGVATGRKDGLVAGWAVVDLGVGAVRGGLAPEVELLAGSVQLQVVDGRRRASSHDGEGRVGSWSRSRGSGGQQRESESGDGELHYEDV